MYLLVWLINQSWNQESSLCIDVATFDPTGDSHVDGWSQGGPGAAATKYEIVKYKASKDMKKKFFTFILEAVGGFGKGANRL